MDVKSSNRRSFLKNAAAGIAAGSFLRPAFSASGNSHSMRTKDLKEKPNILWVYLEDTNAWMSCYGDDTIKTPNIDKLAERGVRFNRAYMPAPVCSPTRSALITGMYQTSIAAHEHYSSFSSWRGKEVETWHPNHIGVRTLPEIFKAAGYYTFNEGKDHYNFVFSDEDLYDRKGGNGFKGAENGTEWTGRAEGQPFFGQIQLRGGKKGGSPKRVNPDEVTVPPYYPDHPIYRKEIAHHYDTILKMDEILGDIIRRLKEDGLYENTAVFFFSDHGMCLPRHKQFVYEGGIRVPLIAAGPGIPANKVRNDLVSGLDVSGATLELAGIEIPAHMHAKGLFADDFHREFVFSARDRCDYTIDRIRAVVGKRYKYIRNFMTDRPYLQPQYRDGHDYMKVLRRLHEEGRLNDVQDRFVCQHRPAEELYDLQEDPHETVNLVHSWKREHALALTQMRDALYRLILETDDKGRFPETDEALKAVVDRWGSEKTSCPEYNRIK
ncbi:sulfatase family protein [Sedimentisphaera salicampi]|uniref:sulfatase family protein n=1 Tax=Sedimentisphaera salicampi TaxID=1941349 RepID=UPI000B9CD411|nr:sulfatase [Sedimentisphaera salicampi]OXU15597.1 Arylsulfatase precursor [Sedimentisphaera salicampi]